jgi:hypothetical protein
MKKQKADQFIAKNIAEFGFRGTNLTHNEAKHPELSGNDVLYFSKDNHFVWGYNGKSYINRRSSSCMYFTDYLKPRNTGSILPLDATLIDVAEQLQKEFGRFSVVNRGRVEDIAFIHACYEAGVEFNQLAVEYRDDPAYTSDYDRNDTMTITPDMLLDTANIVTQWLRTKSLDAIQDITIARKTTNKLVYPSRLNFVNHNFGVDTPCGPAYWALCDAEEDTALLRYGWYDEGMSHITVANLATWYPSLMASQLNDPILKKCLEGDTADAHLATDRMWRSVCPTHFNQRANPEWWNAVQNEINHMHDGGKCNEKWYTPLHHLLDTMDISHLPPTTEEAYGTIY